MYGRTGSLIANEGQGRALADLLLRAAELVGGLDGALHYVVGVEGDIVTVTEVWSTAEHHRASLEQDDVRALIGEAMPLIAGFGDSTEYEVLGGLGL